TPSSYCFQCHRINPQLHSFPTRRSSDLSRLTVETKQRIYNELFKKYKKVTVKKLTKWLIAQGYYKNPILIGLSQKDEFNSTLTTDRKSTRLNSSHVSISYAVFCLKQKN